MPRGGFGNRIAMPLQHGPRALGHSVFLDEQLRPYPDQHQWVYLASLQRIDAATVELIARDAADRGSVVGVPIATIDEDDATPWMQLPSRKRTPLVITEQLPRVARAVLAQRLFVNKSGLPSPLINQIKRLAAFQIPGSPRHNPGTPNLSSTHSRHIASWRRLGAHFLAESHLHET